MRLSEACSASWRGMRNFNAVLLTGRRERRDQRVVRWILRVAAQHGSHDRIGLHCAVHAPRWDQVAEVVVVVELAADRRLTSEANGCALLGHIEGITRQFVDNARPRALADDPATLLAQ